MKDNENKEILIKDTPIIPLEGNIRANNFSTNNNISENNIYDNPNNTPIRGISSDTSIDSNNHINNNIENSNNDIFSSNIDTVKEQENIFNNDTIQSNIQTNDAINSIEQTTGNNIYPNNIDITPIQDNIVQPNIVTDNTTSNMEQPVDHNIYPNNMDATSTQDSIIQPTTPTDNIVNSTGQTVDNNIYSNNMDATSTQDSIIQPTTPTDNTVNNMEQTVDNNIYPNNTGTTPTQDSIVQPTTVTDNTTSNMEQTVNNNTEENVSIQNNNDSVTLGTVEVKGSDELKMEAIENKKKKIKKIINITIISVVGLIILAIIIGLTYFLINRNKNKVDRIGLVVDKFVEKSNLNDISNTINFINSYLHGNLVDSANYIDSNYKFKININSQIGALKDLSNYNYTYSIIPREGYKQYRITVGTDNVENYMLDIVGAHYNDNDYYRFKGIDDDNEYVLMGDCYFAEFLDTNWPEYRQAFDLQAEFVDKPLIQGLSNEIWSVRLSDPNTGSEFYLTLTDPSTLYVQEHYGPGSARTVRTAIYERTESFIPEILQTILYEEPADCLTFYWPNPPDEVSVPLEAMPVTELEPDGLDRLLLVGCWYETQICFYTGEAVWDDNGILLDWITEEVLYDETIGINDIRWFSLTIPEGEPNLCLYIKRPWEEYGYYWPLTDTGGYLVNGWMFLTP